MSLRKLREFLIEIKLYFVRTATYINIFNFLMIFIMFLNTTAWDYSWFQQIFLSRKIFIATGTTLVIIIVFLVGYLDTRLRLWQTETARGYRPERNPLIVTEAFRCAKMLNELKTDGQDASAVESKLNAIFEKCGTQDEFDFFKKNTAHKK